MTGPASVSWPTLRPAAPTLFEAPSCDPAFVPARAVGVVGMPSDWTHSSRIGTRFGPSALRRASTEIARTLGRHDVHLLVDASSGHRVRRRNDHWIYDCGDAVIDPANVVATTASIAAMTQAIRRRGAMPLALGGDHYNSYPACLGYAAALAEISPGARFGYIQIDGHLDFSNRLGAWGTHNHATNARRISEIDNIARQNMVWIGITGWVDGGELADIGTMGGKVFSSGDVHALGAAEVARQALQHALRGCEHVYLSVDIDAMDAGFLPGTGSIVHSGLTPRQYCQMLDVLAKAPIDGLDIVEVSPPLDPSGRTERIAAHMLARLLGPRMLEAA